MRRKLVLALLLATITALAVTKLFVYDLTLIQSNDMAPSLMPEDLLLANKLERRPRRGQLVLFEHPAAPRMLVRRVVALPGESFSLSSETPSIDGEPAQRSVVGQARLKQGKSADAPRAMIGIRIVRERIKATSYVVLKDPRRRSKNVKRTPTGHGFYVMSDNRNHGADSREFGPVAPERIRAVITHRFSAGPQRLEPGGERASFERFSW